jgi:hypothetical protein
MDSRGGGTIYAAALQPRIPQTTYQSGCRRIAQIGAATIRDVRAERATGLDVPNLLSNEVARR